MIAFLCDVMQGSPDDKFQEYWSVTDRQTHKHMTTAYTVLSITSYSKNLTISKSKMVDRHQREKSQYICDGLTNFDNIWHGNAQLLCTVWAIKI